MAELAPARGRQGTKGTSLAMRAMHETRVGFLWVTFLCPPKKGDLGRPQGGPKRFGIYLRPQASTRAPEARESFVLDHAKGERKKNKKGRTGVRPFSRTTQRKRSAAARFAELGEIAIHRIQQRLDGFLGLLGGIERAEIDLLQRAAHQHTAVRSAERLHTQLHGV